MTDEKTILDSAKEELLNQNLLEGKDYELAQKFCNKYEDIKDVPIIQMNRPACMVYYNEKREEVYIPKTIQNVPEGRNIDRVPVVAKTMLVKRFSEDELPENAPDDRLLEVVYDRLVELEEEKSMNIYFLLNISQSPVFRYKSELGLYPTEEEAKRLEEDYPYEKVDDPTSNVMIRFARRKLW